MSTRSPELSHFKIDRLLANIVVIHEVSRHPTLRSDLPKYVASALGASSASLAFVDLDPDGKELRRTMHSTATFHVASGGTDDWVADLLREAIADGQITQVTRFLPTSTVSALYPIDGNSAIAFHIQTPAAVHTITEGGRALLQTILAHIALNLRCQATSVTSPVRSKPLLKSLTKAEWRVLLALDSEATEKEIASNLGTTANTLHSHIKSIYRRLGVQSRLSALAILRRAERQSLIEELQRSLPSNSGSGESSDGDRPEGGGDFASAQPTIALLPLRESQLRPNNYISFSNGDMRAG